jgi:ketosteroid isomerase-like protein
MKSVPTIISREYISALFKNIEVGNSAEFFKHVVDNVDWKVMGTHPLAGHYHGKETFLNATFRRLHKILNEGVILKVRHIFIDSLTPNTAIVEMDSLSTAKTGKPFNNIYCWIVEFNTDQKITLVRAYVDSALVQSVIDENE